MKAFQLLFLIPIIILLLTLILSFTKKKDAETKITELHELHEEIKIISSELKIEKLLTNDLNLGTNELSEWINRSNVQTRFWNEFINKELNIACTHSSKSSSSVNTEINKLLSYLNRTFLNRNIKLGNNQKSELLFFNPDEEKEKKYGFGFTSYDGFWPSFDKNEANTILIQAKIIKEICEFLLGSYEPGQTFTLLSIKREEAGPEDKKHIGENLYENLNQTALLRDSKLIDSYVFQISFTGKTKNCRTFINQLRSPYSLRSLKVVRQEENTAEQQAESFEPATEEVQPEILPIIRDISSSFALEIEYVYQADSSLSEQLTVLLSQDSDSPQVQEILKLFN